MGFDFNIIKDVGAVGILLLVILMIARGNLVPKRTVDALLAEKQKAIDFLTEGVAQREKALNETIPLVRASVDHQETVVKMVTGMSGAVDKLVADRDTGR